MPSELGARMCSCGEYFVRENTVEKIMDEIHQLNDPCYVLTDGGSIYLRKDSTMEFTTFVRKPFVVEAVEITTENIAEVAKHVGDLRQKDDGTPFILADRRLVPNVIRVFPGYFMTRMGENIRCYSPRIFKEQFIEKDDGIQPWLDFLDGKASADG